MYEYSKSGNVIANFDISYPYRWNPTAVANILEDVSYIGHTCNFRFGRRSYKDRRKIKLPKSEHRLIENTHEPLIDVILGRSFNDSGRANARKPLLETKVFSLGSPSVQTASTSYIFTDMQVKSLKIGSLSALCTVKTAENNAPCMVSRKVI